MCMIQSLFRMMLFQLLESVLSHTEADISPCRKPSLPRYSLAKLILGAIAKPSKMVRETVIFRNPEPTPHPLDSVAMTLKNVIKHVPYHHLYTSARGPKPSSTAAVRVLQSRPAIGRPLIPFRDNESLKFPVPIFLIITVSLAFLRVRPSPDRRYSSNHSSSSRVTGKFTSSTLRSATVPCGELLRTSEMSISNICR